MHFNKSDDEEPGSSVNTAQRVRGVITVGTASAVLGGIGRYWAVLGGIGRYWAVLGGIGRYWAVLGGIGRYWAVLGGIGRYLVFVCFMRHVSRAVVYGRQCISA